MAPGLASAMSARCAINARAVVSGAKVRRSPAPRRGSRRFGGRSAIVPRATSDAGDGNEPEADGKPFDPTTTNETRLRSIKGNGGPSPDGDPDPEKPKGPLDSLDRGTLDLINLLVVTGGLKGSIAVVGGALVGINALATIHPDLASLSHGAAFAAPVAVLDALVMVPNWELSDDARDEMAKGMNRGEVPDKLSEYRTALAKYQREEALSNPCRSMPGWQDGLVACVARLTDEMLERAVVLGFLGTWIADRAVEAGMEPYDVEAPAMYAAVAACLVFFEVRIQRRRKRAKDAMRAFRVQRDALTGKQKMVPMTDDEVKALMTKGVKEFEKEKTNADDTRGAPGDVPEGLGGVGLSVAEKATVKTEAEVADLVEAVTAEGNADDEPIETTSKPKADAEPLKPKVPMPPGPPMPLGLAPGGPDRLNPVGSLMFNADVKRTLDRFRSRITLLTQCVCFVTAPALVGTNVPNLFAPIAGGLVCDLLFIAHQRLAMRRLFEDAEYEMPTGGAPPKDAEIKKAQMKLLKKDLDRRRRVMANVLMESVDNSVAEGAAEFNIQMREVVKEVQEAKGYTRQDDALTEVLDAIHKKFPPAKLSEMDEAESVSKMRSVLVEIREELANPKTDEEKEADRVAQAKAELEKDPIDREPWRSLEKTLVEDQALTHEEAREQMNGVMKKIEEGAAANLERAKQTEEDPEAAKGDDAKEEEEPETKRTITLGDISELANSLGELPPAKSIFEQAREEKEAEIEAKAKAAELDDEENERTEPTGEFASTISALDRLTAAIDEKLEAKDRDGSQKK